ncbi:hypothetical protein JKF63_04564 [Porcisia hertigi]|uniref:ENTH domain-containing protein n=1 Tax=Porcisia hertigi TaxID=2761500 RepID=A0A836IPS4_9TRYP|nr:hypothetical protein JKF63_04564 [Porcisia hertigi]
MNFTQQLWSVKEWGRVKASGNEFVAIVHEATNEDKWGPTGPQMEAVCHAYPIGGSSILKELRSRLNNRDKAWRPCYKSLLVLDYLARNVDDRFLPEIYDLVPLLRNISTTFYYTNPKGVDHGVSVRERARKLSDLLSDGLQLREERNVAAQTKEKLSRNASEGSRFNAYSSNGGSVGAGRYKAYQSYRSGAAGSGSNQAYDSYHLPTPSGAAAPHPRTKEEQERYDMEIALRMQRDEERRSGISAEQLEEMYANKIRQRKADADRQKAATEDDERLARRLQEEEEERARRQGQSLPTLNSEKPPATAPKTVAPAPPAPPASVEPAKPPQPTNTALDDLFAPAVAAPLVATAPAASADPFDAFLDSRAAPAPQQQSLWGQSQKPPALPQENTWGQPQAANHTWALPQPPQQPSAPLQQPQQQPNSWGQPVSAPPNNSWGPTQPQQPEPWGQFQHGPSPPLQSPPPPPPPSSWGQLQPQSLPGGWGQPSAPMSQPPVPPSSSWGQSQQADTTNNAGSFDNMWDTLNQFASQQHRK